MTWQWGTGFSYSFGWQSGIYILVSPDRNRETRHLTHFEITQSWRKGGSP